MMTAADIEAILADISFPLFPSWRLVLLFDGERPFLIVHDPNGRCSVTGAPMAWQGREWKLSPDMTRSQIVWTAFKALQAGVEHEMRESFRYRGIAIAGPHLDVGQLATLARRRDAPDAGDRAR